MAYLLSRLMGIVCTSLAPSAGVPRTMRQRGADENIGKQFDFSRERVDAPVLTDVFQLARDASGG